jgi:hypothetical protein
MPYIVLPLHSWLYFQMTTRTQQRHGNLLNAHKHEKQEETPQCSKVEEEEDKIYGSENSISKQKVIDIFTIYMSTSSRKA